MRKTLFKNYSKQLNRRLFTVDKNLGPALLKIRELCIMSKKISYIDVNIVLPLKYDEFKSY